MTDTLTAVKTTIPHVIAGARADDDARRGPVFNPATGEQTAEVVLADAARIDEAVAAASAAQVAWRNTGLGRRSHVMFKLREIVIKDPMGGHRAKVLADLEQLALVATPTHEQKGLMR